MSVDFDTVRASGLTKTFGATRALAGVSLTLRAGEITVVEGHNGSGKSTLLALLAQLARPTRGEIRYGEHVGPVVRGRIGVLTHAPMLYPDLSGHENLSLVAELYELPRARVDEAIARHVLAGFVERPVKTYSRGQLQRTSLARALLPTPRFLLLDEPSTGLDAASTESLVRTLQAERDRGAIVLVVTHDAALVDALAGRRLHMERGRLVTVTA